MTHSYTSSGSIIRTGSAATTQEHGGAVILLLWVIEEHTRNSITEQRSPTAYLLLIMSEPKKNIKIGNRFLFSERNCHPWETPIPLTLPFPDCLFHLQLDISNETNK